MSRAELPSVAVVIPCYNYGRYLAEALRSVLAQTHPADEIVVVDDGSSDETADVARAFHPQVRLIHKQNGGLASARNAGARAVSTDLVVFLDADDRLDPAYLERCLSAYVTATGKRFVYTQWQEFGDSSERSHFPAYDGALLRDVNFIHASALLPRDVVLSNPYYERIRLGCEDWDFYLGLHERGFHGVLVDEPLLQYRKHGTSMLRGWDRRPLRARLVLVLMMSRHPRTFGRRRVLRELRAVGNDLVRAKLRQFRHAVR
jgi:glycosyltransferase involved in cell wall biosynthesis